MESKPDYFFFLIQPNWLSCVEESTVVNDLVLFVIVPSTSIFTDLRVS